MNKHTPWSFFLFLLIITASCSKQEEEYCGGANPMNCHSHVSGMIGSIPFILYPRDRGLLSDFDMSPEIFTSGVVFYPPDSSQSSALDSTMLAFRVSGQYEIVNGSAPVNIPYAQFFMEFYKRVPVQLQNKEFVFDILASDDYPVLFPVFNMYIIENTEQSFEALFPRYDLAEPVDHSDHERHGGMTSIRLERVDEARAVLVCEYRSMAVDRSSLITPEPVPVAMRARIPIALGDSPYSGQPFNGFTVNWSRF